MINENGEEGLLGQAADRVASRADAFEQVKRTRKELYEKDDSPVLRASTVAFLDLLGTTARMGEFGNEDLGKFLVAMERVRSWVGDEADHSMPQQVVSFSDNIVIGTPYFGHWYDLGLLTQVFAIQGAQLDITLTDGFLLRGGLVQGPLYMADGTVIGKALVDAHDLEQATSYPRVEVAPDTIQGMLAESLRWYDPLASAYESCLLVDRSDNATFIHYLSVLLDYAEHIKNVRPGLQAHRQVIRKGLRDFDPTSTVRGKYVWAAEYHNWFCSQLGQLRYCVDDPEGQIQDHSFQGLISYCDEVAPEWRKSYADQVAMIEAEAHANGKLNAAVRSKTTPA